MLSQLLRQSRRMTSTVATASATSDIPSAFVPRNSTPEAEEIVSKGFKSWKSLGFLLLANAIPIGGGYLYFKASLQAREEQLAAFQSLKSATAEDVIREVHIATKSADTCLMIDPSGLITSVSPHAPEDQTLELIPETQIASFKYDPLVDVLTARYTGETLPLSAIHLGLPAGTTLGGTLVYSNRDRGELVALQGKWSVVSDPRLKDYYWRSRWGGKEAASLVRFESEKVTLQSSRKPEDSISPMVCVKKANQWVKM